MTCDVDLMWNDFMSCGVVTSPGDQSRATGGQSQETGTSTSNFCSECKTIKIFSPEGLPTCPGCGLVESHYIDDSPEWISGVTEDGQVNDKSRCVMPQDLELFSAQWGMSSIMSTRGTSYKNKRLAMINFHNSMNHKDRALFHAYKDFDLACVQMLSLPDSVVRDAKVMYRKFGEEKLTRGAVRTGIKANCVLWACKLNKVSRTTKEVADAFGIPAKDLSRTGQIFKDTMGLSTQDKKSPMSTTPHDIIHRLMNEFDIPDKRAWRVKCLKMADLLVDCVPLMGKTPTSVATVIIYKVLQDQITKQVVCEKCKISLPTLNKIETIVNNHLEVKNK